MNDLRPTLFLAQLSNLLAGNISIVHGVTGSSRTFMGEESAGVDAVRIGLPRIAAGQSDIALVGGAQNAERKEMLMLYEFGGFNLKARSRRSGSGAHVRASRSAPWAPSWCWKMQRMRRHAALKPLARLAAVVNARTDRKPGDITATLERAVATRSHPAVSGRRAFISGATGAEPATSGGTRLP